MNRALQIAHTVLFLAAAGLCAVGSLFLWTADQQLRAQSAKVQELTKQAAALETQFGATLEEIGRPCNSVDAHGRALPQSVLCGINETTKLARNALGKLDAAETAELKRRPVLEAQETQTATDVHTVLTNAAAAIESAKATIDNLQPAEAELEVELRQSQRATAAITALAMDPNLRAMAKNLNSAAGHADTALSNVADTTGDVKQAVHGYLHPKLATKIWHGITGAGVSVAKFFW